MSDTAPVVDATKLAAATSKAERVMVIMLETQGCYREAKYKEGDPRRDCHLGLAKIEARVCQFCTFFSKGEQKAMASLTGATIPRMLEAIKKIAAQETLP